ncbi:hypothetical protein Skr01_09200 [Sphaerisporangium krabiense]|uniref:Uncharacterized protein n=1 Tax=Sphaerisporangium krabiense TaxID=763782 RepID=A0A7W9DU00_9ACTN|nr:hypothetical protein [Sphaerisporangium krabiense]MBB5631417.1 hypothetical protein [Sphaerisporangium krabiense]GII60835.1 hypothetical protein Skr01_09200 [Sphaerisporangium krabiense]
MTLEGSRRAFVCSIDPGGTLEPHYSRPALRYVSHFGGVRPDTRAAFDFCDVNSGALVSSRTITGECGAGPVGPRLGHLGMAA